MKKITRPELIEILRAWKRGATPLTITSFTEPAHRKTNNPYDKILKFSVTNGFTGHDYEASVQRQQVREGMDPTFQARERKWGTNINNVLIEKQGKYYIRVRPLRSSSPVYFTLIGKTLTRVKKEKIEMFLSPVYHSQIQGTEKEILHRDYMVDNLYSVNIAGTRYQII